MTNKTYRDFMDDIYTGDFDTTELCLKDITETLVQENIVNEDILNEGFSSSVVNGLSMGLMVKMKTQVRKIKQETDTNKKLDEMGVLVQMSGYGGLIGGFIGNRNTKILNKMSGVKR
jgi:hypothetical protein